MKIEHIAIWTHQLEILKAYYEKYFGGKAGDKYHNQKKQFQSYFLSFESGSRLELMTAPYIPENQNDTIEKEHQGIIHLAFEVNSKYEVDEKARELSNDGYRILSGPRITGDGCYEFTTLDPDNNRLEVTVKNEGPGSLNLEHTLTLQVMEFGLAICRLSGDKAIPDWIEEGGFYSVTRSRDELSIVCSESHVPLEVEADRNWRALKVKGKLNFALTGILASLVTPLANAGISIFAISTYDTDYLLLKKDKLNAAVSILSEFCNIEGN